jgi:hypothetical protein
MRIAEAMQRSAQANTGATGGGSSAGAGAEGVVDAEFEDVDDPKRRAS